MHTEGANHCIEHHQLTPGHMLTLCLPEGSTLLCQGPAIQLSTTPLAALEACSGYQLQLHNGQSWRAPAQLWVQLLCVGEGSRIQLQLEPEASKENRPGLASLGRWFVRQWPGSKAASSIKRGQRAA